MGETALIPLLQKQAVECLLQYTAVRAVRT